MKIALIAFDDFTDLDLILHWDILNRVRYICGVEDWSVKILGTKESHLSTLGLPIPTSGKIEEAGEADGVIITVGEALELCFKTRNTLPAFGWTLLDSLSALNALAR